MCGVTQTWLGFAMLCGAFLGLHGTCVFLIMP